MSNEQEQEYKPKFCPFNKSDCVGELCGIWVRTYFNQDKKEWHGACAFAVLGEDAQERLNLL